MPPTVRTHVITMGGTIDKDYIVSSASLEVADSFFAWIMPTLRLSESAEIVELAAKDSLELADTDRSRLLQCLAELSANQVVVTHGTDTLLSSARATQRALEEGQIASSKRIAFTGAFAPGRFAPAEGAFNIGFALAVVQAAPPGVYVAVGGRFAPADEVRHEDGRFHYD